jgi:hypothetical protein
MPLEIANGDFDTLGKGLHLLAEVCEAISARRPRHQLAADLLFQLGKPPMNGRLAEAKRLSGRNGAAMVRDREKVF